MLQGAHAAPVRCVCAWIRGAVKIIEEPNPTIILPAPVAAECLREGEREKRAFSSCRSQEDNGEIWFFFKLLCQNAPPIQRGDHVISPPLSSAPLHHLPQLQADAVE